MEERERRLSSTEIKDEAREVKRGQIKGELSHVNMFEFYQENTEEQMNILSRRET